MTTVSPFTVTQAEFNKLVLLPEYADYKLELWEGEVLPLRASTASAQMKRLLVGLLHTTYRSKPVGCVMTDPLIELPDESYALQPAIAIITGEPHALGWDRALRTMPDCVIEIQTTNESAHHMRDKAHYYRARGCRLPIMIYPTRQCIEVSTPSGTRTMSKRDVLYGGGVLPGFSLPVARLFGGR